MVSAIQSALSGLAAASRRVEVSAQNIANQFSTRRREHGQTVNEPYVPQQAASVSLPQGGVQSVVRDATNPVTTVYAPDHPDADAEGLLRIPNVDTATELVNQKIASYDYRANLKSIKTADEMQKNLLDILS